MPGPKIEGNKIPVPRFNKQIEQVKRKNSKEIKNLQVLKTDKGFEVQVNDKVYETKEEKAVSAYLNDLASLKCSAKDTPVSF
ncbi:hypothetical protein ACFL2K_01940 [Candidatus Margulisiibacteriota bacterium]